MAVVGCLGDISFFVSADTVRTLHNLKWSGSARYAVHQRHLGRGLLEFTGTDPDKITFALPRRAARGVNPAADRDKSRCYWPSGRPLPLVIGRKAYGSYRWVITGYSLKAQAHDRRGNIYLATLSVTLQEYLRR